MAFAAPSGSACTAPVRDRLSARCVSLAVLGADRVARCQDDHQDEQSVRPEVSHLEGSGRRLSLSRSAHDLLLKVALPPERSFRAELFSFLGLFWLHCVQLQQNSSKIPLSSSFRWHPSYLELRLAPFLLNHWADYRLFANNAEKEVSYVVDLDCGSGWRRRDRKSTRLNSSHRTISYAVFCLKK